MAEIKVVIKLQDREIELTPDEAKEVKEALDKFCGQTVVTVYPQCPHSGYLPAYVNGTVSPYRPDITWLSEFRKGY